MVLGNMGDTTLNQNALVYNPVRGRELVKSLSGCRKRLQLISLKEDRERRD